MTNSRLTAAVLVAFAASCDAPETTTTQVASGPVPLKYIAYVNGFGRGTPKTTPGEAYTDALARLDAGCSAVSQPKIECLGTTQIAVFPEVWLTGAPNPVGVYGYTATFNRYIEGVNAVRAMFAGRSDTRAVDLDWSLTDMHTDLVNYNGDAKYALFERNELVEDARKLTTKFRQAGEAVYGAEHAALLQKQQLIGESRAVIERYQSAVTDRQSDYEALATEYKAFHNAEPTEALEQLVSRASAAQLPDFPALQHDLVTLVQAQSAPPQDLAARARRLEGFFESTEHQFIIDIEPYRAFLTEEGMSAPDLTTRPREILEGMQRYLAGRQQRMNAAAEKLFSGIQRRKSALILLQRDAQTRATIADASRARSAADFLSQATAQIQATWAAAPIVSGFELLGTRYQAVLALIQAGTMCADPDVASWMSDGCGAYAINVSKASLYLQSTLPRKLRRDAVSLRNAGVPSAQVDALESAVASGDLAKAVALHDTIAHEVTP
jgi:hypothetical protein